ncbi:MAG: arsenosugar biosynthesis radical SAM (seleno)protein ArsS [Cyanobacteria bacterium P01_H01_bin.15]
MVATSSLTIKPFLQAVGTSLTKSTIKTLQINLGKRCNLACAHCHVDAGPKRTEELTPKICAQIIELIERFDQIETVDLTGGAPEMNYGFRAIAETARRRGKTVIVRSNLTIYFVPGFESLPEYFAQNQLQVVASLPCYLEDNVTKQRGAGVYQDSILAIQRLNSLGYGSDPELSLDLVYNPPVPRDRNFSLTPDQVGLEQAYKEFLSEHFNIRFNRLFTITNLPIGRTKDYLQRQQLYKPYLQFLAEHHNNNTISSLMCRHQLSLDYLGHIFDCDFNQMENIPALSDEGHPLTVADLLSANTLDRIALVQTAPFCYGCTAGSGSSCGGALV